MGNKSKQNGRVTPKAAPDPSVPQQNTISVNPDKLIAILRQKLEASEHRGMVLEVALDDCRQELAALRTQFDEIVSSLPNEDEPRKKKIKEKVNG